MTELEILSLFLLLFEYLFQSLQVYNDNLYNELFEIEEDENHQESIKRGERMFNRCKDDTKNISELLEKKKQIDKFIKTCQQNKQQLINQKNLHLIVFPNNIFNQEISDHIEIELGNQEISDLLKSEDEKMIKNDKCYFLKEYPDQLVSIETQTILNDKPIIVQNCQFNTIKQNLTGDCALLSSIYILLYNKLLRDDMFEDNGNYIKVKIFIDCAIQTIYVSKTFLYAVPNETTKNVLRTNEIPIGCNYEDDLIPALVEKAFALVYGSYSNSFGFSFVDSIIGLIGISCGSILNNDNPEECFEEIRNNISRKAYILSTNFFDILYRITGTHAYPILNVYIMNRKRVIKLYDLHKNCYNITNVIIPVNRNKRTFISDFHKLYCLIWFITVIPKQVQFKYYTPTISKSFNSYRELKNIIVHSDCSYCCAINVYMMQKTLQKMNNYLNRWVIQFIPIIVVG